MITIPKQLQNPDFRFIKLQKKLKDPVAGKSWLKNLYQFNSPELLEHIKVGGNYGIVGGQGRLRILDVDDKKLAEELISQLKIFAVQTCGGLYHFYFISDYDKNHKSEKGELRSNNMYVVGPNCYAIDKKKNHEGQYKVIKDFEIKEISKEYMQGFVDRLQETQIKDKKDKKNIPAEKRPKDESRSGLEYRRIIALLREGKTREEIFETMLAYSKWKEAPEQYREHTYTSAEEFYNEEKKLKKDLRLKKFIAVFTNKKDLASQFYNTQPIYYSPQKIWWFWSFEKYRWERVDETDILNAISKCSYADTINSKQRGEIIEALKQIGRMNKPLEPEKTWIQFKNKIVDIKTNSILKASYKYFITNPIPWEIGETENTPIMDKIFKQWVYKEGIQDESYVKTLYEIIAYSLLIYMPIHRIFCLIGTGLNGKGSFLRLIEKFLGKDNITSTNLDILTKSNFEASKLYQKLAVIIGEIDKSVFTKTALLKSVTGDDLMRIEYKGKDGFDTHLYATPISACNILPETTDKTQGFFRRWTIVDFVNIFDEKKDILIDIPEEEYHNLCKKCIRIIKDVLNVGEFTNDGSIEKREQRYEERSNPIDNFVKKFCKKDIDEKITFDEFYEKFTEYLRSMNYRIHSKIEVSKSLHLRNYEIKRQNFVSEAGITTSKHHIFGLKFSY